MFSDKPTKKIHSRGVHNVSCPRERLRPYAVPYLWGGGVYSGRRILGGASISKTFDCRQIKTNKNIPEINLDSINSIENKIARQISYQDVMNDFAARKIKYEI